MAWGFYGRSQEVRELVEIFQRNRWFFAKMTGRRRIGKTTLTQHALRAAGVRSVLYVQIPDSGPGGVSSAVADALETFDIPPDQFARPQSLPDLARLIGNLARSGFVVVLDEFQYFNRAHLEPFCSLLQAEVDALSANSESIPGGLIVLGSIHTEMVALLENRSAPLYNRITDEINLSHLDIASVLEILRQHADPSPQRLLFLWTLFEGVPKFYRDCYEQGVLASDRERLLLRTFFESSSPLRTEADNWFLRELRGRYDVVLKFVARHDGCMHNELVDYVRQVSGDASEQVAGYLRVLTERSRLIEKKLPIFASPRARRTRYYLTDNFLRAWLAAIASPVAAVNFRPAEDLVATANQRLSDVEGHALEKLVGVLYEERSKKGIGDFALTQRIQGYWNRGDTEIALVALNESDQIIRFGSCKRAADRLIPDLPRFNGHIERFFEEVPRYRSWKVERVSIAPRISIEIRARLQAEGHLAQDLADLTDGL
ncbi:MAG: ATP-binding protein [Planctomycetes bacterium]|nr:ATP-binding protein [Planctomycetota bacterium]